MVQTKFDTDKYSVETVIGFSFNLLQVSGLLINMMRPLVE